jgi:hypothetical protein
MVSALLNKPRTAPHMNNHNTIAKQERHRQAATEPQPLENEQTGTVLEMLHPLGNGYFANCPFDGCWCTGRIQIKGVLSGPNVLGYKHCECENQVAIMFACAAGHEWLLEIRADTRSATLTFALRERREPT